MSEERKDEEIVARVRAGDSGAAGLLLDRYLPLLRRRVRRGLDRRLRRRVAESDVIQETFIAVMRRLDEFEDRGEGSFGRWVNTFVDNKMLDEVRRHLVARRRSVAREHTQSDASPSDRAASQGGQPSQGAMAEESVRVVQAALGTLPDDYGQVLRLVHFDGLTLDHAAAALGRTPAATRRLYGRALSRLREQLEGGTGATT